VPQVSDLVAVFELPEVEKARRPQSSELKALRERSSTLSMRHTVLYLPLILPSLPDIDFDPSAGRCGCHRPSTGPNSRLPSLSPVLVGVPQVLQQRKTGSGNFDEF